MKIDAIYEKLLEVDPEQGIDATTLASVLNMSRSNVSHELNKLFREGKILKTSTRPVLFSVPPDLVKAKSNMNKLDFMLKTQISLKKAIEQVKAAILYPPKGIPSLIFGETGVGKSMIASLMHQYAIDMGIREKDSPFIVFNCADYSNNSQLLTSRLFGVKKGTYTGADSDKAGLIEKANGGVLFLDEVHRLPPEGQEALFTFLDSGLFIPLGSDIPQKSDVLIITATTEDPSSSLLQTFTRRIPMVIRIPSLKERSLDERLFLIKDFFKKESIKIGRDIYVSLNTMRALLSYDCPSNVGQLKSDIQLICARAYSEYLTNIKPDVRIRSSSLPSYIKEGLYKGKEHRLLWNKIVGTEIEFFKFSNCCHNLQDDISDEDNCIYQLIEEKLEALQSQGISNIAIENILEKNITKYFHSHVIGVSDVINRKNLLTIIDKDCLDCVDNVVYFLTTELKRRLNSKIYTALALHINTLINRINTDNSIVNPDLDKFKNLYPLQYEIASKAKKIIEKYINKPIPEDEVGYLTIFLLPEDEFENSRKEKVKIILIAHGHYTATSMADVANQLLGETYVIGINAPLEVSPLKVLDKLRALIRNKPNSSGYLLLVDMGSLTTFADAIVTEFNIPAKVVPLASTLHVLEAARKALLGFSLEEIHKEVTAVNSYFQGDKSDLNLSKESKKVAIITACLTGEGAAVAVKSFLNNTLKYDKNYFEILHLSCLHKNQFAKKLEELRKRTDILCIISSFSVSTDIKQYEMYDVINMKAIPEIQEMIDVKTTFFKMPSLLKENIDNFDGYELYNAALSTVERIQQNLSIKLADEKLIGILLHLSFMVSRLSKSDYSIEYLQRDDFIRENRYYFDIVKDSLQPLKDKYLINISDNEVCYITSFFLNFSFA
ncbi:sigma 54-interacting transcriptional regulator [Clostridium folliculivorans]|uniref:Transcriptional regulator n=1 Tax=Clostridium folliculivorans TaxID=2886038 RepID=A0A9W6DBA1_9CLOT|nr:sigma-54-dependent transcriptional regulator [Clostridium folliculivorans]GKU26220.1 transcriptional regulator [Clostridium folliculivorans]GKU31892.1 transcriptional regulator [Clostridium folliculivorans]